MGIMLLYVSPFNIDTVFLYAYDMECCRHHMLLYVSLFNIDTAMFL